MEPVLLSGSGNQPLAAAIARELRVAVGSTTIERFPDGELHVEIPEDVLGQPVCVVQSLGPRAGAGGIPWG
jgi:ribose-phosphate pyrophosphokinase